MHQRRGISLLIAKPVGKAYPTFWSRVRELVECTVGFPLQTIVRNSLPEVIAPRNGRSFAVYTNYDDRGWFTLDLHAEKGYVPEPTRTSDYTGLCCVVVTSPPGVTVYWVVETNVGWGAHLASHARPNPEPGR